jgi:PAS domain S-box-containing protein
MPAKVSSNSSRPQRARSAPRRTGKTTLDAASLQAILDSTPDAIVTIDHRGRIQTCNKRIEQLFGYRPDELLGKNVKILAAPPHREPHDSYLERYLTTGDPHIIGRSREVQGERKDGSRFPVLLWVSEVRGLKSRTFLGIMQDISLRKESEEARDRLIDAVIQTASRIATAATQILAATTEQAAGAQEQAAAVAQTVTTVDEVARTSEQAAERARTVAEQARGSVDVTQAGRKAVQETSDGIAQLKDQVEGIAESIVALAEQAQAIGDIIGLVSELAEQTNMLALNASIEAARAGEQGRGFAVVAGEIRALADQSRRAFHQARQILSEIQNMTNSSVMVAEEGSRSVNRVLGVCAQTGDTVNRLADIMGDSARGASQIAASANQQAAGMLQIHQAMKNINTVMTQTAVSSRQMEKAAEDLATLGKSLRQLVSGFER